MPATEHWKSGASNRKAVLGAQGVFWHHDGNPKRPNARLNSGLISNGYFNGENLCQKPIFLESFASALVTEFISRNNGFAHQIDRFIGPAMGAITFAHSVASSYWHHQRDPAEIYRSYAEKDGANFVFKRSPPRNGETILLVEDTVTTGGSILKVRDLIVRDYPDARVMDWLFCFCNRTGHEMIGTMEIISLVDADFQTWKEGESPFTPDGKELVPVVEKVKENWSLLAQDYP